jgi:pteridine reductase
MTLEGKTILITGSARRLGEHLAIAAAQAGANVVIHHGHSPKEAEQTAGQIIRFGRKAWVIQADLEDPGQTAELIDRAATLTPIDYLVNNAAIFEDLTWETTELMDWNRHLQVNLTAPFQISQAFARHYQGQNGAIVNILDWRALRPGADHLPYTISKAGLAALNSSLAAALAPRIRVNGIALGAILPPSDGNISEKLVSATPAKRWANLNEVSDTMLFLLSGPGYITGEVIHVDGGRHLI